MNSHIESMPLADLKILYKELTVPPLKINAPNLQGAVKVAAKILQNDLLKQLVLNRLIQLTTNMEPAFFWKVWTIQSRQKEYRIINKKKGRLVYNCELCSHPIEHITYQYQLRHDYVCPQCWTEYITNPNSPLKKVDFLRGF